jgi:hypothetical protein
MAQKPVDVTVNVGVSITVDINKVTVKKGVDTVAWRSTKSNQEFGIEWESSAGEPAVTCDWQGNKWVCSAGPFDGNPRTVKYTVTASGTPPLDPDVEVIPLG